MLGSVPDGLRLIDQWRDGYLAAHVEAINTGVGRPPDYLALGETPADDAIIMNNNHQLLVELYYGRAVVPVEITQRTLDRILSKSGYTLPARHPLRTALTGALRQSIEKIRSQTEAWDRGEWCLDNLPTTNKIENEQSAAIEPLRGSVSPSDARVTRDPIKLSNLCDLYMDRINPSSKSEYRLIVREFHDFGGDPLVHEITFPQAEKFYDILKLQPNSKTAQERKRSVVEIANEMRSGSLKKPFCAGSTAAKKIRLLSAMLGYAHERGYAPAGNPFSKVVGPKDDAPNVNRRSLTGNNLTALFSLPVFTGCESHKSWDKPGTILLANHKFWIPILGMVTGARLEELGQLAVSDLVTEGAILMMHITDQLAADETNKDIKRSVKTKNSIRRLPIHKVALDAGFENYLKCLKETGQKMLFPELPESLKRTKNVSKWINGRLFPSAGINDRAYVFHSLRHSFKDRCRAAKLRRDLHDALTGHSSGTAGEAYGEGLGADDLASGIDHITFPDFPKGIPPRTGPLVFVPKIGFVCK
jgi:integrase